MLLVVLVLASIEAMSAIPRVFAMDFYHPWGMLVTRSALHSNPYARVDDHSAYLNRVVESSSSPLLRRANAARRRIEPTGTPFFYAAFAFLPADFDVALAIFLTGQYAALLLATAMLAKAAGSRGWIGLGWGVVAAVAYSPFVNDVQSGNVNAYQLLGVATFAYVSAARDRVPAWIFRDGLPALLAALLMFKPNTFWILVFLAAHFALANPPGTLRRACVVGSLTALACAIAGSLYFDGPRAWIDWARYVQGMNGGRLLYRMAEGNHSIVMFLSEAWRMSVMDAEVLMTALVVAVFALAAMRGGVRAAALRARQALADPLFAASCGVVFMLATSPLVWLHYNTFVLVPLAWLLAGRAGRTGRALAAIACVMLAKPVIDWIFPEHGAVAYMMMLFAWVPVAAALHVAMAAAKPARS